MTIVRPPTFERYWMAPIANLWSVDNSTWLDVSFLRDGDYESSEGCFMALQPNGEIWERCRNATLSLDGKIPFVVGKYRPLRR